MDGESENPIRFLRSSRGGKLLIYEGYVFHKRSSSTRNSVYYTCDRRKLGCKAGITLHDFDPDSETFSSYVLSTDPHRFHPPNPERVKKREAHNVAIKVLSENENVPTSDVVKAVEEKIAEDPIDPSILGTKSSLQRLVRRSRRRIIKKNMGANDEESETSDLDLATIDENETVKNVCLFCLQILSTNLSTTALENVAPYGDDLQIRLDQPAKNRKAFYLICNLLHIDFKRERRRRIFDSGQCLPLCHKCQNLYQEVFQLHTQVKELERLMKERVDLITTLIYESETKLDFKLHSTQLSKLGLKGFREKVINLKRKVNGRSTRARVKLENNEVTKSQTETMINQQIIKTEMIKNEPFGALDMDGIDELNWDEDLENAPFSSEFGSAFDDSNSAVNILAETEEISKGESSQRVTQSRQSSEITSEVDVNPLKQDENEETDGSSDVSIDSYLSSDSSYTKRSKKTRGRKRSNAVEGKGRGGRNSHARLTCHICEKEMIGHTAMHNHYQRVHPEENKYTCVYCKKWFERLRGVQIHQRSHQKRVRPFACELCGKQFVSASIKRTHKQKKHQIFEGFAKGRTRDSEDQPSPRKCHLCLEVIYGATLFREHYKEKHPEETKYSCKYCKRLFSRAREALSHQRNKHEKVRLEPEEGECTKSQVLVAILDPLTGEIKEKKKYRKRGIKNGARSRISYTCHLCDETIIGSIPFKKHYEEKHPEEKRYTCKFCQKHFLRLRDVEGHQRKHTGERPYQCEECNKSFVSKKQLQYHNKFYHNPDNKVHTCDKCGKSFPTETHLNCHYESHNETVVVCLTCGGTYISKYAFQCHNRKMHEGKAECSEPIRDPSDEVIESLGVQLRGKLKCFVCWNFVPGTRNVQRHFEEHHPEMSPNKCPHCDKYCAVYKDIVKHVYRHLGSKNIQCDKCPKRFFTTTELNNHSKVHIPEDQKYKHVCDTCGAAFASKHSLQHHSRKHNPDGGAIKWICEICGRAYADRKGYTQHKKSAHSTNPEHKCPHCPKAFALLWELRKHINKHAAQKPYKCPQCDMRFSYTTSRLRHIKEIHQKIKVRRPYKKPVPVNTGKSSPPPPPAQYWETTSAEASTSGPGPSSSVTGSVANIVVTEACNELPREESVVVTTLNTFNTVQWDGNLVGPTITIVALKQQSDLDFHELK